MGASCADHDGSIGLMPDDIFGVYATGFWIPLYIGLKAMVGLDEWFLWILEGRKLGRRLGQKRS